MAVLLNCFILCVWQFNLVRSTGISLPLTSIAYKATPTKPKSLSLSFSANDNVDSKITNSLDDFNFKPIKTSQSTEDEELSKKTMSVSKLLSKLGLISDNDSTVKDLNFSKQKQNVDPNILYEVSSQPQKNIPNLRTNINEKSYNIKDIQNKENNGNYYNIKVISPPAVFNNLARLLPVTQNVGDRKLLSETNKYSQNVLPTSLPSYPVRTPTERGIQESTKAFQNKRKTFSNCDDGTKDKIIEPLLLKNTINNAEHDLHQIRNIVRNEDIITPKHNSKFTCDLNVNKTQFNIDNPLGNSFDIHKLSGEVSSKPIKFLDTSYFNNNDILPTISDVVSINQDITSSLQSLTKYDIESNEINDSMSSFNYIKDKLISKQFSMDKIPSKTPISYVSKQPYTSDVSPTLPNLSPPKLPEISKPQQIYTNDYDTYNLHLSSSLDNIVSFLTSKFMFALSDISTKNSLRIPAPLNVPEPLHPHIITDLPGTLSKTPVFVSSYPEVESPTYLPKPKVNIQVKDTDNDTKKKSTKSLVPYISSVTINYMPSIESSNEIIIFV